MVIAAALVCYLYPRHSFKEYRNVNEQARLYLVKAVVEDGVLNIDRGIREYGDLQDKAVKDGHFYCDKPVGLSAVAVPVYWVLHLLSFGHPWTMQGMRYALTLFCVTLPAIVLLFLLERHWRGRGATSWLVGLGLPFYALGSIAFTYSTQFVGHRSARCSRSRTSSCRAISEGRPACGESPARGSARGARAITDYFSALVHPTISPSTRSGIRPVSAWFRSARGRTVLRAASALTTCSRSA